MTCWYRLTIADPSSKGIGRLSTKVRDEHWRKDIPIKGGVVELTLTNLDPRKQ